jgi:hypothetical protein
MATEVLVRVYKNQSEYQRDAQRLSVEGWRVVSVTEQEQRSGCIRIVLLWFLALLWKPKPRILVTYNRVTPTV